MQSAIAVAIDEEPAVASTTWHLCWQTAIGREFFPHPSLYPRIRERLIHAHQLPGRALVDYTLLPTEIHIISQIPPGDTACRVARGFGNLVARWVREAQPVRSPVLAGPYGAHLLGSAAELQSEARMLAWRPVCLGLCAAPTDHSHGALPISLGVIPEQQFDPGLLLRSFGETEPLARAAFRDFIADPPSRPEWRAWERARGLASRPTVPWETCSNLADELLGNGGIDEALGLLDAWVAAELAPRDALDLKRRPEITGARRHALVACLAVHHGVCSAAAVARCFRRANATLSRHMKDCRARKEDARIVSAPVQRIVSDLAALELLAYR